MDFASLMSAQIAKAKGDGTSSGKKYIKNSEIEAQRKAAYEAEQKALEVERAAKAVAKRKREDEAAEEARVREEKRARLADETRRRRQQKEAEEERARRKRLGLPEVPPGEGKTPTDGQDADDDDDDDEITSADEIRSRLRNMGEPAVLFGETDLSRRRRYRRLTTVVTQGPIPTTLRPVDEKEMRVPSKVPADKAGKKYLYRQLASYFGMVLREWELALEKERRDTMASKAAYNVMVQSRENMRPVGGFFCPPSPLPPRYGNIAFIVLTCEPTAVSQV